MASEADTTAGTSLTESDERWKLLYRSLAENIQEVVIEMKNVTEAVQAVWQQMADINEHMTLIQKADET